MATKQEYVRRLEELGLSPNEARVYFAALSLGPSNVQQLAVEAGIKRTTMYSVIDALRRQGLMAEQLRGFKRHFVAESPGRLERLLSERHAQLEQMLPDLESLSQNGARETFIRHYEGIEGARTVYDLMIADAMPGDDYLVLSHYDHWFRLAPDYFPLFIERRAKTGAKVKMLLVDTPIARERKKLATNYSEEVRFLPATFKLVANLVVTPKRALIHQLISPFMGLLIENASVVQMHQQMYWLLWAGAAEQ